MFIYIHICILRVPGQSLTHRVGRRKREKEGKGMVGKGREGRKGGRGEGREEGQTVDS